MPINLFRPLRSPLCFIAYGLMFTLSSCAQAKNVNTLPPSLTSLPDTIDSALSTFHTPGMAVSIVKNGETVYRAGHGIRDLATQKPVTPETYFRLASTSKAFTAAALALLVQDGKATWTTPVIDVLPGFRLADPWVTREITLIDLLTHRSGLASGAGDSMLWPEPSGFSTEEVIHNLRYLTPASSFRSEYAYSNVMYITAGAVVEELSGMPLEEFVDKRIFAPLDMPCYVRDVPASALSNVAASYGYSDERGQYAIPRNTVTEHGIVSAAAGGVTCNVRALEHWVSLWLNEGKRDDGSVLLEEEILDTILSPHTILSVSQTDREWDGTLFRAYGLGWRLSDVEGRKVISHTGTISGYQAYIAMVPALELGVVILNNGSDYGARGAVMQTVLKGYLTDKSEQKDWVSAYVQYQEKQEAKYLARHKTPKGTGNQLLPTEAYAGIYHDAWFGTMTLTVEQGNLRIVSDKMPTLKGTLEPFDANRLVIRWDNKNAADDAFILFDTQANGEVSGFSLLPFESEPDDDHPYRDMYFSREIPSD